MTAKAQILEMAEGMLTKMEMAERAGCTLEYVRTVIRDQDRPEESEELAEGELRRRIRRELVVRGQRRRAARVCACGSAGSAGLSARRRRGTR